MKALILSLLLAHALWASEYYAKAEPVDRYAIKASISGAVIKVDENQEGKVSDGRVLIMIDDRMDKIELDASKEKLAFLQRNIDLSKQSVSNARKVMQINQANYKKVQHLASYSTLQKDTKRLAFINSNNSYIQSKSALETLKTQLADLKVRIARLQDSISKKNISIDRGLYIYKLYPRVGDFVTMGAPLVDSADISKARLVIYVNKEDLEGIEEKKIYLNDKATDYKIAKLWKIADSKNISAYRCEIIINQPKVFSSLMKVEFK